MTLTLLGPQRFATTAGATVRALAADGPVATVTAGWREREPDDTELDQVLDGRSLNLALYGRWLDVVAADPDFATAERRYRDQLDELQAAYALRLDHAMQGLYAVQRREGDPRVREAATTDALRAVRALDDWHLATVAEVRDDFTRHWPPNERPVVRKHRTAVAGALAHASVLVLAGGHVGALLRCLRLFDVAASATQHLVAWSAGAMVLCERVVLFHDRSVTGYTHAEAFDAGLGLCRGVVALPHARQRLLLDDAVRTALFAQRFAPASCVILDDGVRVPCADHGALPPGTRVLGTDGQIVTTVEES